MFTNVYLDGFIELKHAEIYSSPILNTGISNKLEDCINNCRMNEACAAIEWEANVRCALKTFNLGIG